MAQEKPGQTLQATALVHAGYLRLVGLGFSLRIRPMVVAAECSPARARTWASFFFPKVGSRCPTYRTKSGNLFTGARNATSASGLGVPA
jgi:hypothetical protein